MLKAYQFIHTGHQKLHNFVMAFFDRIEFETGDFNDAFFDNDFLPIVKRHRTILKGEFSNIYREMKQLSQEDRTELCESIRESNDLEKICSGDVSPRRIDDSHIGLLDKLRAFFIKLYKDVLDGAPVNEEWGITLREHFDSFREANKDITLCPMCGISELKTEHDEMREQYDHYLPKSIYPFSAVNFYNLIPTCKDCNSLEIKGDKDIIELSDGKLFYPYDQNHQGIDVDFKIIEDTPNILNIKWQVILTNSSGKEREIEAWKRIYNIEERYISFIMGRMEKWYKAFCEYLRDDDIAELTEEQKRVAYFVGLKADEAECLSLIRRPAFQAFIEDSPLARARQEALYYS